MRRRAALRAGPILALALLLAACGARGPDRPQARLELRFEEVLAPEAFQREGPAVAEPEGAPGYWAVTPGLPRPERGLVERLDTGAQVQVALYGGRGGEGGAIRLSRAAAEALELGASPAPVRVTAVRREPSLAPPRRRRWF